MSYLIAQLSTMIKCQTKLVRSEQNVLVKTVSSIVSTEDKFDF